MGSHRRFRGEWVKKDIDNRIEIVYSGVEMLAYCFIHVSEE